jgi:hypothetical protein
MVYIIDFLVIIVVVIRLNMKYYQLKGNSKDFVMKKEGLRIYFSNRGNRIRILFWPSPKGHKNRFYDQ